MLTQPQFVELLLKMIRDCRKPHRAPPVVLIGSASCYLLCVFLCCFSQNKKRRRHVACLRCETGSTRVNVPGTSPTASWVCATECHHKCFYSVISFIFCVYMYQLFFFCRNAHLVLRPTVHPILSAWCEYQLPSTLSTSCHRHVFISS